MGDHPADFHRARFSQLKPQLLVERSGGNVLRSRIKPYRFAGMLPRSFHRILEVPMPFPAASGHTMTR